MKTIGIDIGTTKICGVLTEDGNAVKTESVSNDFNLIGNGEKTVQDANAIYAAVKSLLKKLSCENTDKIAVTGQMHGVLYCDGELNALSPLFTWQYPAAENEYKEGLSYAEYLSEKTDTIVRAGYGLATHFYNAVNGLVPSGTKKLLNICDYVANKLAGRTKPLSHCSIAASLGGYSLAENDFSDNLARCGVDGDLLPSTVIKPIAIGGVGKATVYTAIGDNQASVYCAIGNRKDKAVLNVGTGSQISAITDALPQSAAQNLEVRPYVNGNYLLVGSAICGGYSINLLKNFYEAVIKAAGGKPEKNIYALLDELALLGIKSPSEKPVFNPLFKGTRERPDLTADIRGLSATNFTPANVTYALYKGVIDELYGYYEAFPRSARLNVKEIVGTGNGIKCN